MTTSLPLARNSSATWDPMYPAPPVRSHVCVCGVVMWGVYRVTESSWWCRGKSIENHLFAVIERTPRQEFTEGFFCLGDSFSLH